MEKEQWLAIQASGEKPLLLSPPLPAAPTMEAGWTSGTDADGTVGLTLEWIEAHAADAALLLTDPWLAVRNLGCDCPGSPSTAAHPLAETDEMPCHCMLPSAYSVGVPAALEAARQLRAHCGALALLAPVQGPFSMAYALRGGGLIGDLTQKPDYVRELMDFCAQAVIGLAGLYLDTGMDGLVLTDPALALLPPLDQDSPLTDGYQAVLDYLAARDACVLLSAPGADRTALDALSRLSDRLWIDVTGCPGGAAHGGEGGA